MLHIITTLYRPNLLESVYLSIPKNHDITWHISKSNTTPKLTQDFLLKDSRVIIYEVDCLDTENFKKKNAPLSKINDGYFCFLDDDTIFHKNLYDLYQKISNEKYVGMVVGSQIDAHGNLRLSPSVPIFGRIDTGNVICEHSCAKHIKFPEKLERGLARDFQFWRDVYVYYNNKAKMVNETISIYNKLKK